MRRPIPCCGLLALLLLQLLVAAEPQALPHRVTIQGHYETSTLLQSYFDGRFNATTPERFHLTCSVRIARNFEDTNLLRVDVSDCQCPNGSPDHCLPQQQQTFFFTLLPTDGVDKIYFGSLTVLEKNLYRGLASLLQTLFMAKSSILSLDSSGSCQVRWKEKQNACFEVTKQHCESTHRSHDRPPPSEMFGMVSPFASSSVYCVSPDGILESVTSTESFTVSPSIDLNLRHKFSSHQIFEVISTDEGPLDSRSLDHFVQELVLTANTLTTVSDHLLSTTVDAFRSQLDTVHSHLRPENVGKLKMIAAFSQLLPTLRLVHSEVDELVALLQSDEYSDIQVQLFELYAACGTPSCVHALLKGLDFSSRDTVELQERVLFSLSVARLRGAKHYAQELMNRYLADAGGIADDLVRWQTLATIGSLTGHHAELHESTIAKDAFLKQVVTFLQEVFAKCSSNDCKLAVITAAENCHLPQLTHFYLEILSRTSGTVGSGGDKQVHLPIEIQIGVLKALKSARIFSHQELAVAKVLRGLIFHPTKRWDVTAVSLAVDVAMKLDELGAPLLADIMHYFETRAPQLGLLQLKYRKIQTWCSMQLLTSATLCQHLRVVDYHAYSRGLASQIVVGTLLNSSDVFSDFHLEILASRSGLQKFSEMNVNLVGAGGELRILGIHLYSSGLESMTGEAAAADRGSTHYEEEVPITAGLFLNVFGQALRPMRFFDGRSELMSAVWNAPSTLTPLLQSNIQLQDISRQFHLQNGLIVHYASAGAVSLDLSGAVEISIWSQTADSHIRNSGALHLQATSVFSHDLGQQRQKAAAVMTSVTAESSIEFFTNVEVNHKPVRACMQMSRPVTHIRTCVLHQSSQKKQQQQCHKENVLTYEGVSFDLGWRNALLCREMNSDE